MSGVRRLAVDVPLSSVETAITLPLCASSVHALLRGAVPEMLAAGGKAAELGALLDMRLSAHPDERLRRRDAAIVALAAFCDATGSIRQIARQIFEMGRRYETTRWQGEKKLSSAPLVRGERGAELFRLLRASEPWGAPADRTIRTALAAAFIGQNVTRALAQTACSNSASLNSKRGGPLSFLNKPNEFEVVAALARAPSTQKIVAEERARVVGERQARVDRIAALDAKAEVDWPAGQSVIRSAVEKVRAAERRLREANDALASANAAAWSASHTFTRARQIEEAALIAGADIATIEVWQRELHAELDALRRPGVIVASETVERNPVTRKEIRRGYSNRQSVLTRMAAVLEALRASDLLKLEPNQSRVPVIIGELRASLPKVDQNPSLVEAPTL